MVVTGRTYALLLRHVAQAIFATQVRGPREIRRRVVVRVKACSAEELLIQWCRELLFRFAVRGFIPVTYGLQLQGNALVARLAGDRFDPNRHRIAMEIKNVTYHHFALERTKRGWSATLVFDV